MSMPPTTSTSVLCWPKRLLSAEDLRRHLTSQREIQLLPRTVITPLAADDLRARKIRVIWQESASEPTAGGAAADWLYAIESPDALITAALAAIQREGVTLTAVSAAEPRAFAEALGAQRGGILFTANVLLACVIGNKIAGVRAVCVASAAQVARARKTLGANLYAIEIPGPTFFEVRQLLRTIVADKPSCPEMLANLLQELDGHAHR